MTAYDRVVDLLRSDGRKVSHPTEGQARAKCPAHNGDSDNSLSVRRTSDRALLHCHGGCDKSEVLEALGLTMRDLYDTPRTEYLYTDPLGTVVRTVSRTYDSTGTKKTFKQAGDTKTNHLFRLPEVLRAVQSGRTVYLVEGEADVIALEDLAEVVATTAPQGASNVHLCDLSPLHDADVVAVVDKDEAGRKWAAKVRDALDGKAKSLTFVEARVGKDAAEHLAADLDVEDFVELGEEDHAREPLPRVWRATDLVGVQQPSWLAKHRLPRSSVTILVGDEGIGKSLLWVWVVAAITTGRALPEFGIPARGPEVVFIVITEDEWSSTVRPRLEVVGADLSMIRVLCAEKDGSGSPIFPRDMCLIVGTDPKPALVVVDAFLDTVAAGLSMKDPQQARQALHPWKEAATVTGAAIMLLTHTNRVDSKNARDRYGITGELRKKARMTLFAQLDDEDHLVVGPEKSNITGRVPASRFTIDAIQHFTPTEDHDGTVPRLRYVGESTLSAREHLEESYDAKHGEDAQERDEAVEWLVDYIVGHGGQANAGEAIKAAAAVGIAKTTLTRARKRAKVRSVKAGMSGGWVWSLEESTEESEEPVHRDTVPSVPSVVPSVVPSADHRPGCNVCGRRMGKQDAQVGTCLMCQRIAEANNRARSA